MGHKNSIEIEVLFEGTTEENVLREFSNEVVVTEKGKPKQITQNGKIFNHRLILNNVGGKDRMPAALEGALEVFDVLSSDTKRILVLLDLDDKQLDDHRKSILHTVKKFVADVEFDPLEKYENVFVVRSGASNLRIVLHIAHYRCDEHCDTKNKFNIATTDDYVLNLAFRQTTANGLLDSCRRDGWTITPDKLIDKIKYELPNLLTSNGIPLQPEAKEYVKLYGAVLSLAISPNRFAAKTLAHAQKEDIREVFASLIAAIEYLGGEA
jgi:hypothetical protein